MLNIANGIEGLIEKRKYYSALRVSCICQTPGSMVADYAALPKSLDDLENIHLRSVIAFEWARHMLESIPAMRDIIRQAVTKEMKEWLFEAREKQRQIGKLALEAMDARVKRWKAKSQRDPMLAIAKVNSAIEMAVNEKIDCEQQEQRGLSPWLADTREHREFRGQRTGFSRLQATL